MLVVVPQLDGSGQAHVNCGPSVAASGLAFASGGKVLMTPTQVRRAGGIGDGPTDLGMLKKCVESAEVADRFAAAGLKPPIFARTGYINQEQLETLLTRRRLFMVLPIRYRLVLGTGYESDCDFAGGHFVGANRLWTPRGTYFHRIRNRELDRYTPDQEWPGVVDPLADGRWSGECHRRVASGVQLWPLELLAKAADSFTGTAGKFSSAIMQKVGAL